MEDRIQHKCFHEFCQIYLKFKYQVLFYKRVFVLLSSVFFMMVFGTNV